MATFSNLTVSQAGNGYTLSASAIGLTGAVSDAFNIIPKMQLVFQTQPGPVLVGVPITPAVTVQVLDAYSNPVSSATNAITLTLGGKPNGGTLGGTVTQNAVSGVATFANLTVNQAGAGYTLTATAEGLIGTISAPFTVTQPLPTLSVLNAVSPTLSEPGCNVSYTLTCYNSGTVSATGWTLTDTLPANLTYLTGSGSGNFSYDPGSRTLKWLLGTLAAGGAGQVTFQATVAASAAGGSVIDNTAKISSTEVTSPVQSNIAFLNVAAPLSAVNLTTSPPSPQPMNTPITLTAMATGGVNVQYQFTVADNSALAPPVTQLQANSSSHTCVWTPSAIGSYWLTVTATDGITGTQQTDTIMYTVNGYPLTAVSFTTSPPAPQEENAIITITATATGGTNVQYQFWAYYPYVPGAFFTWTKIQGYSSLNTCSWMPDNPGNYMLAVTAKDSGTGTEVTATAWYTVTIGPPLTDRLLRHLPGDAATGQRQHLDQRAGRGRFERAVSILVL